MRNKFQFTSRALTCAAIFSMTGVGAMAADTALSLNGSGQYVTFGAAPGLGSASFTLETCFKRTGAGTPSSSGSGGVSAIPLVTKGRSEADGSNVDMNYFLGIRTNGNVLAADFEEGATGTTPGLNHPIAGVTPIAADGVWHHAAATYDGTQWNLYLDGVLEASLTVGLPPRADSIQHAALGTALNSTGAAVGYFQGVIDEARIWNFARTAQQIADNKNFEIASAAGLVGRWGLNDGAGSVAADSSGSAINGTVVGAPSWVSGFTQTGAVPVVTRGPYLQIGTPSSVIVRWRTDIASDSRVRYGSSATNLNLTASDATVTTEHLVSLAGLSADTKYFYSIGTAAATLAGGADFFFVTSPTVGTPKPTRVWVLGDSGTANANAAAVRDAYLSFAGSRYTDLWLMLGDNAYNTGLDSEYQAAVFNMYPVTLRQSVLWSTIGNHETAQLTNPATFPYLDIFTLPNAGQAGGNASGTEKYYSFDYGNIHFICLDAMTSDRTTNGAMYAWLDSDLASTAQSWLIAFWHHPPYTKGTHDSDTEIELIQMRETFLPILESGGVDLVLCGHSHVYERSYLLNGHYGLSTTFASSMKVDAGNGRTDGTGAYTKPAGLSANQGAVYVVAGSSGQAGTGTLNHPAMFVSMGNLGSVVLDVTSNRLDAKFLRETGATGDYFTIVKTVPAPTNVAPTVSIASPTNGAIFTQPVNVTISANATDSDGTITQVAFYDGATLLGTDTTAPFSVVLSNAATGAHTLTAVATDNSSASTTSAGVGITVNPPPNAPPSVSITAPTNGSTFTQPVNITISANATDSDGTITQVAFYDGATLLGTDTTAPFSAVLSNATAGAHSLTAVAKDNSTASTTSAVVVITVVSNVVTIPTAPTGLVAKAASKSQINLSWTDKSANEAGFKIERSTNGSTFTQIAQVAANVKTYASTGLTANKTYYYRVRAFNTAGNSAYSNVANAKTPKN